MQPICGSGKTFHSIANCVVYAKIGEPDIIFTAIMHPEVFERV